MSSSSATGTPLPRVERTAHGHRLIVDGRPALLLGGQLHNSTPTDVELPAAVDRVSGLSASVVIGAASWSLVEPEEGRHDFSTVDDQLEAARASGLRLILIWFGAFKNATSTYAPTWVRADPVRFPRASAGGRKEAFTHADTTARPVLSVFSEDLGAADRRAFVAFMAHLREVDPQHTVLMVQVENEVGLLRDSRDRSPRAEAAWAGPVPPALLQLLDREGALPESVTAAWRSGGARREGTWPEVFGAGWEADELFMAWHFAAYAEALAAAGKAAKPLPMYVNAWLGPQPGQPEAGDYPSGGPASRVLDVWKAAAPSLDLLAPDIYVDDVKAAIAPYHRPDNPLFVPESRLATGNLFWALGLGAFGFSAFGVDDVRPHSRLAQAYSVLGGLTDVITSAQADGRIAGVLLEEGERQHLAFGDLRLVIQGSRALLQAMLLDAGVQAPPPVVDRPSETDHGIPAPADTRAFGLVIQQGPDEFLVVGQNLAVDFAAPDAIVEIDGVEAGRYDRGEWTRTRVVNGDERLMIVPLDEVGIARVRLLRLPTGTA
ncbi:MAG TPA: DUF5597 domain-containing protein [Amnibacterium sp.]|jgi:hypothetical protein|uniref:GH35 family beta-galactosidase n=1 Tax=Amnibacterium sp. TaxID=1872496 RepID=UPI002F948BD6